MEQLTQFVSKTFEKKTHTHNGDEGDGDNNDDDKKQMEKTIKTEIPLNPIPETIQISTTKSPSERISPKTDAEKKGNLQNVVDVITNSHKKIMENLYNYNRKIDDVKKTTTNSGDYYGNRENDQIIMDGNIEKKLKFGSSGSKTNVMDVANLIGDQNKNKIKSMERNFPTFYKIQLNMDDKEKIEPAVDSKYPTDISIRGSSVSPVVDPDDSRSSSGNSGCKKESHDDVVRNKIYVGNDDDSKNRYNVTVIFPREADDTKKNRPDK
ncbi:hypothetical protein Phum_PHUM308950 [Pediculus humanus corporis]|uniref:Uncharacterized protein n=1 Tax=Pediculus humanus subsp. corporis TaxID=121224 RepID=E0VMH0_PEDHC|nr:uncharacterized protein Phum_PHUM308950 [Pediculus humanus corporis]EEB14576.1 hypothetical protein Phum_PHUM308950 [Pediculus humanus corporis]